MSMQTSSPKANTVPYILVGLTIVATMFGGLGTWAAIAPLKGAVIAPGVVTVYSKRKTVQHLEGGIVREILVRDGDYVEKGQLLVRLDDTRVSANLGIIDGQVNVLRAREARLKAERDGLESVRFPDSLTARAEEPEIADILLGEAELFRARRAALQGEVEILTKRVVQLNEQIVGLDAQQKAKAQQIKLISDELKGLRILFRKGYAPKTRLLALERSAEALTGERGELVSDAARARTSIGETELQIIQVEKEARQAVIQELHEVQATVFDLLERRVAAADEARRIDIQAPQGGKVVGMAIHTLGGIVSPGQPVLDIVPQADELVVETQVSPNDIDKIQPGLEAIVRFSAFNLRSTPELTGSVSLSSADRLLDEASGLPYYLVRVRITEAELAKLSGLKLVPGMPAEVFVQTGDRTALSYLVKPLTDSLSRAFKDD